MTEPIIVAPIGATRERLRDAATALFQANGYHGTGVSAILERTGLPKGSLYHHYPGGKEEIAVAAVLWLRGEVEDFLKKIETDGGSAVAMVTGMAEYAALGLKQGEMTRGSLITVLASEATQMLPAITEALREAIGAWSAILSAAATRQGIRDPEAWAAGALAQLEGATTLARISGRPDDVVASMVRWAKQCDR